MEMTIFVDDDDYDDVFHENEINNIVRHDNVATVLMKQSLDMFGVFHSGNDVVVDDKNVHFFHNCGQAMSSFFRRKVSVGTTPRPLLML